MKCTALNYSHLALNWGSKTEMMWHCTYFVFMPWLRALIAWCTNVSGCEQRNTCGGCFAFAFGAKVHALEPKGIYAWLLLDLWVHRLWFLRRYQFDNSNFRLRDFYPWRSSLQTAHILVKILLCSLSVYVNTLSDRIHLFRLVLSKEVTTKFPVSHLTEVACFMEQIVW